MHYRFWGLKIFATQCFASKIFSESQREAYDDRAIRKADKIRAKLNWQPGILNLPGDKPKGMHWLTYLRLMEEYRDYSNQALLGMTAKMGIVNNRLLALDSRK